jgi:hypothetical protein
MPHNDSNTTKTNQVIVDWPPVFDEINEETDRSSFFLVIFSSSLRPTAGSATTETSNTLLHVCLMAGNMVTCCGGEHAGEVGLVEIGCVEVEVDVDTSLTVVLFFPI